ncbi:MAG TPA: hypothetical protein VFA70_11505, partial [Dehalococcoidia bacterium]|nr:hypothetical protein [Dehalococcoidia bacterium]
GALAPAGRDRALLDRQELLSADSARRLYGERARDAGGYAPGSRPELEAAAARFAGHARPGLATAAALCVAASRLTERPLGAEDRTEEEILASGTATWLERARTLARLAQVRGLTARICLLYGRAPERFHAVCEVSIMNAWAVFDPLAGRYYVFPHRGYASALDLVRHPEILDKHPDHGRLTTLDAAFYRLLAISELPDAA